MILGDTSESGDVALADGPELPFRTVAVQLAEDHAGLGAGVLGEVVASEFGVVAGVHDADVRVANLTEGLLPLIGVVDGDREDDAVDGRRRGSQIDLDHLVVTLTFAGAVVAEMLDRTLGGALVVEEHEMLIRDGLLVRAQTDGTGVQIEVRSGGGTHVPAQTHPNLGQLRVTDSTRLLIQRDVATLAQANSHDKPFEERH